MEHEMSQFQAVMQFSHFLAVKGIKVCDRNREELRSSSFFNFSLLRFFFFLLTCLHDLQEDPRHQHIHSRAARERTRGHPHGDLHRRPKPWGREVDLAGACGRSAGLKKQRY